MAGGVSGGLPKSTGDTVYGADYNAVQTIANGVLGTKNTYGVGYGYNQTVASSPVAATNSITTSQWVKLITDVDNIYTHQNGVAYSLVKPTVSTTISTTTINTLYNDLVTLQTNRFKVAANQLASRIIAFPTYTGTWGANGQAGIYSIVSLGPTVGGTSDDLQYFFNQGGSIVVSGWTTSTFSTSAPVNLRWKNALAVTTATITATTYANILTNSTTFTTLYQNISFPTPYQLNFIEISANTTDSGRTLNIQVVYEDDHTATGAGPDGVTGGQVGATFTQFYSTGTVNGLRPNATTTTVFTVTGPPILYSSIEETNVNASSAISGSITVPPGAIAMISSFSVAATTASSITSVTGATLTWAKRGSQIVPGAGTNKLSQEVWYAINKTAGNVSGGITVNYDRTFTGQYLVTYVYTGIDTVTPFTAATPFYNSGTNRAAFVNYEMVDPNSVVLAHIATNVTTAPGTPTGFTIVENNNLSTGPVYAIVADNTPGESGSYLATCTTVINSTWTMMVDCISPYTPY